MPNIPRKSDKDDFDPQALAASSEQHDIKITDLTDRVSKIEPLLTNTQKMAIFLEECAQDSRKFDEIFAKMFCRFVNDNVEVKAAIQKRLDESDRSFARKTFKRFGAIVGGAGLVLLGAVGKELAHWILSLFPHGNP